MKEKKAEFDFEAVLMGQLAGAVGEAAAAEFEAGGVSAGMSRFEAIAAALTVKAMRGDAAATKLICETVERLRRQQPPAPREVRIVVVRD